MTLLHQTLAHRLDADHLGLHQEHNQRLTTLEQHRLDALKRLQAPESWWLTRFVFWCRTTWHRIAEFF
jgi:hypothetical protein